MSLDVNTELDADSVNNSATTSASTCSRAVNTVADDPRWENSAVTVVKVGPRQSDSFEPEVYNTHVSNECWIPTNGHTSGLRRSSTATTLFHRQIVCRSTHTQHIRRQELRCRRAMRLEQSSGPLARRGHYIQQFQAWTQNVVLMLILCCNETFVNCAV